MWIHEKMQCNFFPSRALLPIYSYILPHFFSPRYVWKEGHNTSDLMHWHYWEAKIMAASCISTKITLSRCGRNHVVAHLNIDFPWHDITYSPHPRIPPSLSSLLVPSDASSVLSLGLRDTKNWSRLPHYTPLIGSRELIGQTIDHTSSESIARAMHHQPV